MNTSRGWARTRDRELGRAYKTIKHAQGVLEVAGMLVDAATLRQIRQRIYWRLIALAVLLDEERD